MRHRGRDRTLAKSPAYRQRATHDFNFDLATRHGGTPTETRDIASARVCCGASGPGPSRDPPSPEVRRGALPSVRANARRRFGYRVKAPWVNDRETGHPTATCWQNRGTRFVASIPVLDNTSQDGLGRTRPGPSFTTPQTTSRLEPVPPSGSTGPSPIVHRAPRRGTE
jgi:hypothetical protein